MAMLNKSMTLASASGASDGILKKAIRKHKIKKSMREEAEYSRPIRRTLQKFGEAIGDKFGQVSLNRKANKGRKRTMEDASGKTSRNSSVGLCKAGDSKCQQ